MSEAKRVPVVVRFSKEQMLDVLHREAGRIISDEIVGKRRWSDEHELVFELDGEVYMTGYSRGSTECQDERPWEYDDEVECTKAEPYEKVVRAYRPVLVDAP
jgi:hypothetical protein